MTNGLGVLSLILLTVLAPLAAGAQSFADEQALLQFQRAADSYAFGHRQTERRGGGPAPNSEGALFTPQVAAAFRSRIRAAMRDACSLPAGNDRDFVVPGVNATSNGTGEVPACVIQTLPKLPPELEYRQAGAALLLADAHLHIVVDVLHGAFP